MKTYYTKCGKVAFQKSSTAAVTRFEEINEHCDGCPYIERGTTYRGGQQIPITFCQSGSSEPNQKTDYSTTREDDATTLSIRSLDMELLRKIHEFVSSLDGCLHSAHWPNVFHGMDLPDCRKSMPLTFESNKKGKAAKKAIIEKFFSGGKPEQIDKTQKCGICSYYQPDEDNQLIGTCPERMSVPYADQTACSKYKPLVQTENPKKYVDTKSGRLIFVKSGIGFDGFKAMYRDAGKWGSGGAHSVKSPELPWRNSLAEAQADLDAYAAKKGWKEYIEETKEADEVHIDNSQKCNFNDEQCPYYCSHNTGCSLRLSTGNVVKSMLEKMSEYNCDTYHEMKQKYLPEETAAELVEVTIGNREEIAQVTSFDYSTVDNDTAVFLQDKEQKITQLRMMSVMAIGKELKEAQDKLSNHDKGTFYKWFESLGLKKDTVYRNINAYEWVIANCDNIELADGIQPSLLFAISKPSAPAELQKAVLDGDITTHKQYKDLEDKLKAERERADSAECREKAREQEKAWEEIKARDNYLVAQEAKERADKAEKALQQLTKAHAVSPGEAEKLQKELAEAKRQVEILTDELMKPVDIEPAVVEKIPEETERELKNLREQTSLRNDYMFVADMLNMFKTAHPGMLRSWAKVVVEENSIEKAKDIRKGIIDLSVVIESMVDYLDDEIQKK
ncbi:MAG TPA: cell envelope integrity protein TolA [Negativicutes bacterium]|nr:cell envelope integrity protein TolA [Negativicutes bacterium]